jgi:hypothetical protein
VLEGAIIGAIAGALVALVTLLRRARRATRFLAAVDGGGAAEARALLDKQIPPRTKIPLSKTADQFDRMAGLALLRDAPALERELAGHTGHLSAVTQVDSLALIGLALVGHDPLGAAERLDELALRVERDGGRALRLVKQKVKQLAGLGRSLAGQPLEAAQVTALDRLAAGYPLLPRLLLQQAIGEAFERAGKPEGARLFKDRVRQKTRAFEGVR